MVSIRKFSRIDSQVIVNSCTKLTHFSLYFLKIFDIHYKYDHQWCGTVDAAFVISYFDWCRIISKGTMKKPTYSLIKNTYYILLLYNLLWNPVLRYRFPLERLFILCDWITDPECQADPHNGTGSFTQYHWGLLETCIRLPMPIHHYVEWHILRGPGKFFFTWIPFLRGLHFS